MSLRLKLVAQKSGLLPTQGSKIVKTIIDPRIVRLVLAAVKRHKPDPPERKSAIGQPPGSVKKRWRPRGLGVSDFMIAANEK